MLDGKRFKENSLGLLQGEDRMTVQEEFRLNNKRDIRSQTL